MASSKAVRDRVSKAGPSVSVELAAREHAVALADAAFATSLEDASEVGEETVHRLFAGLALLIGVGLLAGAVLAVRIRSGPPRSRAPRQRSLASELARSAGIALASAVGRRVLTWWVKRQR